MQPQTCRPTNRDEGHRRGAARREGLREPEAPRRPPAADDGDPLPPLPGIIPDERQLALL